MSDYDDQYAAEYDRACDLYEDEDDNLKLVHDHMAEWHKANVPDDVRARALSALADAMWAAQERRVKGHNAYLDPLIEGQLALIDIPDVLDMPIVAGKKRRVRIGSQRSEDVTRRTDEQQANADRVNAALARALANAAIEQLLIAEHGNLYKAHDAGAIAGIADE